MRIKGDKISMKKIIICVLISAFIFLSVIIFVNAVDITAEYDEAGQFHDGMAWVRKGDKYGYINESGKLVIPMIFEAAYNDMGYYIGGFYPMSNFAEGLAAVSIDGKGGFIDKTGELVIPAIYDGNFFIGEWISYMPMFNEGLARVRKDGNFGYINKAGEVVVPFEYFWAGHEHTGFFTEGLIRVATGSYEERFKWGFVDMSGNIVVPLIYGFAQSFSNGLAAVTHEEDSGSDKWGFIDRTGKLVIPFEYEIGHIWMGFSSFNEYGFAFVWENLWEENRRCGVIDRYGNLVVPYEYADIEFLPGGSVRGKLDSYGEWEKIKLEVPMSPKTGDGIWLIFGVVTLTAIILYKKSRSFSL